MSDKKILHTVIDEVASVAPGNIAVCETETGLTISYRQLSSASDNIRNLLLTQGLCKGEVVGLFFNKSIPYVVSALGSNKAGGVFMPLDPGYPILRTASLIEAAGVQVFLTNNVFETVLTELLAAASATGTKKIIVIDNDLKLVKVLAWENGAIRSISNGNISYKDKEVEITGDDSNYLIYTSGSTGNPKIIEGCHKGLSHFIHWEVQEFGLDSSTIVSSLSAITFDVSFRDIFTPLLAGGMLKIPPTGIISNPRKLLQWLIREKVTLIHIVPSVFRLLTDEIKQDPDANAGLSELKYVLLAGEALYSKDVQEWRSGMGETTELVNIYGPSETTLAKMFHRIKEIPVDPAATIPLGKPLPGTRILILNDGMLCGTGAIGEICIKTPFRSKGYFRNAELTAKQFIQNPLHNEYDDIIYKTGDMGKVLKDGTIEFNGRNDKQVKIRGTRIEPAEVEAVIRNIPGIKQVVIKIFYPSATDPVMVCYYKGEPISEQSFRNTLQQHLPAPMHPAFFVAMEEFPLTLNGKLDTRSLPMPVELLYRDVDYIPPATIIEKKLAEIWSSILGLKKVSTSQSFFSVGGHSLSATRIISQIYKELEKELTVKEFFDHPTIKEQARLVEMKSNKQYLSLPLAPQSEYYPLSHAQKGIWIAQEKGDHTLYNMPASCLLNGNIDFNALEQAFIQLIKRHESLRTGFEVIDGKPVQRIYNDFRFAIEGVDSLSSMVNASEIGRYFQEELAVPFDLAKPPLLRVKVIALGKQKFLFLFTIHHIICDGWSVGIIIDEVVSFYKSIKGNADIPIAPLNVQYKDYTVWYNNIVNEQSGPNYPYWQKQLTPDCMPLQLPVDRDFSERKDLSGSVTGFILSTEASARLRNLVFTYDASLFVVILSALNILLYKYSGQPGVTVGAPVSGRFHPDLERQVGLYLNYLVLRTSINRNMPFSEYLATVKQLTYDAYAHQQYPYDKMVEQFYRGSNDDGRNPFYDVLLVMNNDELNGSKEALSALETVLGAEKIVLDNITSKVALTVFVTDAPAIGINFEYSTELFNEVTVTAMLDKFRQLLEQLPESTSSPIHKIAECLSNEAELYSGKDIETETMKIINEDF